MDAFLETLRNLFEEHWPKVAAAIGSAAIGWFFGRRRAKAAWKKREFLDRLNVSLNSIQEGRLRIRTLLEKRCEDVFLNTVATEAVLKAARETTPSDSILPLPREDYWYYLNAILNEVSEKFAAGQLSRDLGISVRCDVYLICLTCECSGPMRTRKVRAMLIRKSLLRALPEQPPQYEREEHSTRWLTLQQLATSYPKHPERFLEVELCV
jgi:hypothetical protein